MYNLGRPKIRGYAELKVSRELNLKDLLQSTTVLQYYSRQLTLWRVHMTSIGWTEWEQKRERKREKKRHPPSLVGKFDHWCGEKDFVCWWRRKKAIKEKQITSTVLSRFTSRKGLLRRHGRQRCLQVSNTKKYHLERGLFFLSSFPLPSFSVHLSGGKTCFLMFFFGSLLPLYQSISVCMYLETFVYLSLSVWFLYDPLSVTGSSFSIFICHSIPPVCRWHCLGH